MGNVICGTHQGVHEGGGGFPGGGCAEGGGAGGGCAGVGVQVRDMDLQRGGAAAEVREGLVL